MEKVYSPSSFEDEIYKSWEESGCFTAKVDKSKKPFTIMMPPPNITGQLHMGHALDTTIQDAIIRYKRMKGFSALWMPGTDHASIATEVKIVERMKGEGLSKSSLGREGFLERAWDWKREFGGTIVRQMRKLGTSCDWSREAFTMDDNLSRAVKQVFVNLYNKGLIYQADRIINLCPKCGTAISDAEVEYSLKDGHLWHIKYNVVGSDDFLVVATTRPETMLGDTAVAVNPDDIRYAHFIGKKLLLPLANREIPVVADSYVDKEFGTGCVKITPAHDPNDFEVGVRHGLPVVKVMNDDSTMNALAGVYQGLTREECRKRVVEDLSALGLLTKVEAHPHNVGECHRCSTVIEPIISKQWFVKMKPLAEPAIDAVKDKSVRFMPKRFEKIYLHWMENIRDWCISRQLWWGHRIPAYTCASCGKLTVTAEDITKCACGGAVHQDEDVLDTWFSSALWPFSTLGYPNKTEDLDYFYPTNVLVTAYDIIFFWVARMIFSGIEHMGSVPFSEVLIHGIVRDSLGRKMSKSLNNGVDPLDVIKLYGADALRISLVNGLSTGGDIRYSDSRLDGYRNFINKLWNASRFVQMHAEGVEVKPIEECKLSLADKWILTKLNRTITDVSRLMDRYEVGQTSTKMYDFIWSDFCDWYIELTKPMLYSDDLTAKHNTVSVLVHVLRCILKLIHPIIPFVTEEIYKEFSEGKGFLMNQSFPIAGKNYKTDFERMERVMALITDIRAARANINVPPSRKTLLNVLAKEEKTVKMGLVYLEKLGGASEVRLVRSVPLEKCLTIVSPIAEVYIPMGELVDVEQERARLCGERSKAAAELSRANGKLANQGFVAKAPKDLLDIEREKVKKYTELLEAIDKRLANL